MQGLSRRAATSAVTLNLDMASRFSYLARPANLLSQQTRLSSLQCTRFQSVRTTRHFSHSRSARSNTPAQTSTTIAPPPPPSESGYARLTSRRLISIAGVDAAKFLQGIITSSIQKVHGDQQNQNPAAFYAGFLNATGRVLYDVFIYPDVLGLGGGGGDATTPADQSFIIEVDADQLPLLMRHLKRYKLRSKFTFQALDDGQASTWQVWGSSAQPPSSSPATSPLSFAGAPPGTALSLPDARAPGMGYRVLTKGRHDDEQFAPIFADNSSSSSSSQEPLKLVDESAYTIRRYLLGVPEGPREMIPESALPLESNMDLMGGIDFRKGCYVGQELTIRTKHRGVVRKRILPCVVHDPATTPTTPELLAYKEDGNGLAARITTGTQISKLMDDGVTPKKGRTGAAGTWLAGVGNVGLALCRLQTMTDVRLPGETAAVAEPSSYDVERGFAVAVGEGSGEMARVKAFVPGWVRKGLEEQSSAAGH